MSETSVASSFPDPLRALLHAGPPSLSGSTDSGSTLSLPPGSLQPPPPDSSAKRTHQAAQGVALTPRPIKSEPIKDKAGKDTGLSLSNDGMITTPSGQQFKIKRITLPDGEDVVLNDKNIKEIAAHLHEMLQNAGLMKYLSQPNVASLKIQGDQATVTYTSSSQKPETIQLSFSATLELEKYYWWIDRKVVEEEFESTPSEPPAKRARKEIPASVPKKYFDNAEKRLLEQLKTDGGRTVKFTTAFGSETFETTFNHDHAVSVYQESTWIEEGHIDAYFGMLNTKHPGIHFMPANLGSGKATPGQPKVKGIVDHQSGVMQSSGAGAPKTSWLYTDELKGKQVVIPFNPGGNHWTFAVVDCTGHMPEIKYYDSMCHTKTDGTRTSYGEYFEKQVQPALINMVMLAYGGGALPGATCDLAAAAEMPQQKDGHNCGIFVCAKARELFGGSAPVEISGDHSTTMRHHIAKELLHGKLHGDPPPSLPSP